MPNAQPTLTPEPISKDVRLEVCIPSRGRTQNLNCLLQALRSQRFEQWDLTIVDDNPDDALRGDFTFSVLTQLLEAEGHRCRIIQGESAGVARAHNLLLTATRKPLIARIDDDTLPGDIHYLSNLVACFWADTDGRLGAAGGPIPHFVGGPVKNYRLPPPEELAAFAPFEAPFARYVHPEDAHPHPVTTLYSSFIYKRSFALAAGGFPVAYSLAGEKEETDMLTRIAFLGGRLMFHPHALLWHLKVPAGGTRSFSESERESVFQQDYRLFVQRVKALKAGTFDWAGERRKNLDPCRHLGVIKDETRGYIAPDGLSPLD